MTFLAFCLAGMNQCTDRNQIWSQSAHVLGFLTKKIANFLDFIASHGRLHPASVDIPEVDTLCVQQYSLYIRLKVGEIRLIDQKFVTEKLRSCHFPPKFGGP